MNIQNAIGYADVLFIAKVAAPYQVSEETFAQIVAALNAPNVDPEGRADAIEFFALACNMAAKVEPRAADVSSIYRAACECARRNGVPAFGDKQPTKLAPLV
jgi:hypothetical protein